MRYELTKDLLTGNALIDSEHKQLFDAINALLDACAQERAGILSPKLASSSTAMLPSILVTKSSCRSPANTPVTPPTRHSMKVTSASCRTPPTVCCVTAPPFGLWARSTSWPVSSFPTFAQKDRKLAQHLHGN